MDARKGLIALAGAALALAACDGGGGGEAGSGAVDPGFLTGIEEAWRVPGSAFATSDSGTWLAASRQYTVTVYPVGDEAPEAAWSGECDSFGFFGDRLVCDGSVIDVETGEVTELLAGGATFRHSTPDALVLLSSDSRLVGFNEDLEETWARDGVGQTIGAGPRTITALPGSVTDAYEGAELVDIATGEVIATGPGQELADGYMVMDLDSGTTEPGAGYDMLGYTWEGEEAFSLRITADSYRLPLAPAGEMLSLADVRSCLENTEPIVREDYSTSEYCMVSGDTTLTGTSSPDAIVVDGVEYPKGVWTTFFVDTEHILLYPYPGSGVQPSLYAIGSADPIWTLPVEYTFTLVGDGSYLVGSDVSETVLFRPAG